MRPKEVLLMMHPGVPPMTRREARPTILREYLVMMHIELVMTCKDPLLMIPKEREDMICLGVPTMTHILGV